MCIIPNIVSNFSPLQFGRVVSMPLAAAFCASPNLGGWPALYVLLGTLTCCSFALFYLLFRDRPKGHPYVFYNALTIFTQ
jgi:uncharacterized membrane protein YwaF